MYFTVYRVTNLLDGRIYVGIHKTQNLNDSYLGSGRDLREDIKRLGRESFLKEYIAICDTEAEMIAMEEGIVDRSFVDRDDTYNLRLGGVSLTGNQWINGMTGKRYPDRARKQQAKLGKQFWASLTPEDRAARLAFSKEAHQSRGFNYSFAGENSFKGKKHTEETKELMRLSARARTGPRNSAFGSVWLHNPSLGISKRVYSTDEVEALIQVGWVRGRRMKQAAPKL